MSTSDWVEFLFPAIILGTFALAWYHHRKHSKGDHHERNHTP